MLPVSFMESKCVRFKEAEPPVTISFRSKVSLKVQGQVVGLKVLVSQVLRKVLFP